MEKNKNIEEVNDALARILKKIGKAEETLEDFKEHFKILDLLMDGIIHSIKKEEKSVAVNKKIDKAFLKLINDIKEN